MHNISPDTVLRWNGGCWSAVPQSQQNTEAPKGAPSAQSAAPNSGGGQSAGGAPHRTVAHPPQHGAHA